MQACRGAADVRATSDWRYVQRDRAVAYHRYVAGAQKHPTTRFVFGRIAAERAVRDKQRPVTGDPAAGTIGVVAHDRRAIYGGAVVGEQATAGVVAAVTAARIDNGAVAADQAVVQRSSAAVGKCAAAICRRQRSDLAALREVGTESTCIQCEAAREDRAAVGSLADSAAAGDGAVVERDATAADDARTAGHLVAIQPVGAIAHGERADPERVGTVVDKHTVARRAIDRESPRPRAVDRE